MSLGEIFGIAAGVALVVLGIGYAVRGLYFLRGPRLVTSPETGGTVAVDLDLKYSAVHSLLGRPHFREGVASPRDRPSRWGAVESGSPAVERALDCGSLALSRPLPRTSWF